MRATRVAPGWPAPSLMHRRRVMADRITYVGLDVHKEGIVVAVAEGGLRGEVREYGRVANTAAALNRLVSKLGGEGVRLRFCYEAGPCGYGIQRHLSGHGHECIVVAPSLIPRRAGDRVKTDRRDARSGACASGCGACVAPDTPAAVRLRVAPGLPLRATGLDQAASPLARGSPFRTGGASYRARGLRSGGRSCRGPARSADGADRSDAAGLDVGPSRGGAANDARHGVGQCSDVDRRTGRPVTLRQSAPAHGLSRAGAV